jgi:deoxyribonuclease IV
MNIGAHVRGGGKLIPSLDYGAEIGATSIQIFTQSPRMWKPSLYDDQTLANFREAQANHASVNQTFCHAVYLINLATDDKELFEKSLNTLTHTLSVGRGMASDGVVLHVGSHKGHGFDEALKQIAYALEFALDNAAKAPAGVPECPILIENTAGAGGTVGRSFDEIEAMIDACGGDERLGLCIDTQHLWASGFDYSTIDGANTLVREIDTRIGLDRLKCFHLNDSKTDLGGNRDRHANVGEGTVGERGLAALMGHPAMRDLPMILEVPGDGDGPRAQDVRAAEKAHALGVAMYDGSTTTKAPAKKTGAVKVVAPKKPAAKAAAVKKSAAKAPVAKKTATKAPAKKVAAKKNTVVAKAAKKSSKKK